MIGCVADLWDRSVACVQGPQLGAGEINIGSLTSPPTSPGLEESEPSGRETVLCYGRSREQVKRHHRPGPRCCALALVTAASSADGAALGVTPS